MNGRGLSKTRREEDRDRVLRLKLIKLLHTLVWTFFAACIGALPLAGLKGRFDWALALSAIIALECLILIANRRRCPLTDLAGRFTDDRRANFDIYLPLWLARHNLAVFGSLSFAGELIVLWCWFKK